MKVNKGLKEMWVGMSWYNKEKFLEANCKKLREGAK